MFEDRMKKQLEFIYEIDKVKSIFRKSKLFDSTRFENDAEHSWTICVMAVLFKEYSNFDINIEKVLKMLLIHDVVEIYAGDTFLYSNERATAHINEDVSAKKIFGMLEADQAEEFYLLWKEFEERKTNEAKYAAVFDRLEPVLQNYKTKGFTWKTNSVKKEMVLDKCKHIEEGSIEIWNVFKQIVDECAKCGYLD
jgi:putative hydrolases of HD superfamily